MTLLLGGCLWCTKTNTSLYRPTSLAWNIEYMKSHQLCNKQKHISHHTIHNTAKLLIICKRLKWKIAYKWKIFSKCNKLCFEHWHITWSTATNFCISARICICICTTLWVRSRNWNASTISNQHHNDCMILCNCKRSITWKDIFRQLRSTHRKHNRILTASTIFNTEDIWCCYMVSNYSNTPKVVDVEPKIYKQWKALHPCSLLTYILCTCSLSIHIWPAQSILLIPFQQLQG